MSVSPLAQLIAARETYQPSAATRATLADKTLVMIVGPTGVGKSSVVDEVVKQHPDFAIVNIITTRPRKPEDPDAFRTGSDGFDFATALELLQKGEIVEYTINTNNQLYGQTLGSFPANVNVMPVLPKGITPLQNVGFGRTIVVYLLADADEYRQRLEVSRADYADVDARLDEALDSFEFARQHGDSLHFVLNAAHSLEKTAQTIAALIAGEQIEQPRAEQFIDAMERVVRAAKGSL